MEKKSTAGVIPNAIRITTLHSKYLFSAFMKRDFAFNSMKKEWQQDANHLVCFLKSKKYLFKGFKVAMCCKEKA
jgi:hypothetical protein